MPGPLAAARPRPSHLVLASIALAAWIGPVHAEPGDPDTPPPRVTRPPRVAQPAPAPPAPAETVESPPAVPDEALPADGGEVIVIEDRAPAESASSVHFGADELRQRPHNQPSDILRQTPGLVVAQHAGGGKSDQYFLRGFDADHGTDVAVFVDGVPVNLTSHGHGQGYADSHWLIPETIGALDVHKGPYSARFGDFYTAGAIELTTVDPPPGSSIAFTAGTELAGPVAFARPTYRTVGMVSPDLETGTALIAGELSYTDGPFIDAQQFRRGAFLGKWSTPIGGGQLSIATNWYAARWNQSGQIPAAEVAAGRLDRFGAIDATEGGASSRSSLGLGYDVTDRSGARWKLRGHGVTYRMRLFSDFTLFERDPVNGDQIEQTDDRLLYGMSGTYERRVTRGPFDALARVGVEARADDVIADLWHTAQRRRLADCFGVANPCNRADERIRDLAAYVDADIGIGSRVHLLPGFRVDQFVWDVDDLDPETMLSADTTGGTAQRAIASPKLSALVHVGSGVDAFANAGAGFHSNDARAAVSSRGRGALARALGGEVGARLERGPLRASAALWYLHLSSEQVWSGDLGGTEPSDPTRRIGADFDVTWSPVPWLTADANVAVARSTLVANRGNGGALALAPRLMGGAGVTARDGDRGFAALRVRGIGDRPANDDGSLTADGYVLVDAVAGYKLRSFELGLSLTNLLDATWREAQFADVSRVRPDAPAMEDVHFTPGAPLTAMVTIGVSR